MLILAKKASPLQRVCKHILDKLILEKLKSNKNTIKK